MPFLQIRSCMFGPNPHWMEPAVVNGSIHTGRKQHQRNCLQIWVLASSVDWGHSPACVLNIPGPTTPADNPKIHKATKDAHRDSQQHYHFSEDHIQYHHKFVHQAWRQWMVEWTFTEGLALFRCIEPCWSWQDNSFNSQYNSHSWYFCHLPRIISQQKWRHSWPGRCQKDCLHKRLLKFKLLYSVQELRNHLRETT